MVRSNRGFFVGLKLCFVLHAHQGGVVACFTNDQRLTWSWCSPNQYIQTSLGAIHVRLGAARCNRAGLHASMLILGKPWYIGAEEKFEATMLPPSSSACLQAAMYLIWKKAYWLQMARCRRGCHTGAAAGGSIGREWLVIFRTIGSRFCRL